MQTWNEILDFPAGIGITDVRITAENSVGIRESALSFKQEVQVFSGQRLKMSVNFKSHDAETGCELEAFILKLRGRAGRFRFFDPYHSQPMGQAMGLPTVTSANAGSQTLTSQGWIPNVNFQLRPGDYLQLGEDLHRVLDPVHSNGAGESEIKVWPNLRRTHDSGAAIILRNPTGLWRLAKEPVFRRSPVGQKHLTSMECVEAL